MQMEHSDKIFCSDIPQISSEKIPPSADGKNKDPWNMVGKGTVEGEQGNFFLIKEWKKTHLDVISLVCNFKIIL